MFDENGTAVNLMALNNAMMAAAAAANNTHQPIASNHPASSGQMVVNQLLGAKDSRWLQLEVCREFQRGQCSRTDEDCKFAHPPPHVDIQNGRVTACYDSIKGRCTRDNPKCKYLHPPQHLKDQLLMNGKQHLAMKSLLCAQLTSSPTGMVANGYNPALPQLVQQSHPFVSSVPMQYFSQLPSASIYPALLGAANGGPVIQSGASAATVAAAAAQSPPLSTATLQQLLLLQQQLQQQQQQQQAAAAAALSANSGVQPNSALLVALALQQQQQQQHAQMTAALSAGGTAGQLSAVDGSQQPVLPASSSRKRNAQVAGIGTEELGGGKQPVQGHADSERRERTHVHMKDVNGSQSPNHAASPAANGASAVVTGSSAAAVNLLAYQQQQQQQQLQLQYLQQCQLLGLATQTPTSSSSSNMAVAQHLNMKRSAGDKNGAGILAATNGAMYAAQAPLNPYLLQQIPAGYLQFSGQQIPPRY